MGATFLEICLPEIGLLDASDAFVSDLSGGVLGPG
jgi:hypothetical protein